MHVIDSFVDKLHLDNSIVVEVSSCLTDTFVQHLEIVRTRVSNSGQKPIAKANFFFESKSESEAKRNRFAFAFFRNKAKKANFLYSFTLKFNPLSTGERFGPVASQELV